MGQAGTSVHSCCRLRLLRQALWCSVDIGKSVVYGLSTVLRSKRRRLTPLLAAADTHAELVIVRHVSWQKQVFMVSWQCEQHKRLSKQSWLSCINAPTSAQSRDHT